ncbi:hypothetical protein FXO37_09503 [Capsicum annuum]|nr:hypothetical protein FXO37_09503 [Capsicum annuum]
MQGKAAYDTPLWWGPSLDTAHSGSFSAPGCPLLNIGHRSLMVSALMRSRVQVLETASGRNARIKKLRYEDSVMRKVRSRRKAQDRWDKLRKYVMYTYAPNQLEEESDMRNDGCCTGVKMESLHRKNSSVRGRGSSRLDTISFSKRVGLPREKVQPCGLNSISVVGLHLLLLYKFHGDCKLLKSCLPFPESHCNED